MRILLLFLLLPVWGFGQVVEPKLHPAQIGAYSAPNGNIGQVVNGVGAWVNPSTLQGSLLLPTASVHNTLRYGSSWEPSSFLSNTGTAIGINTASPSGAFLHIRGSEKKILLENPAYGSVTTPELSTMTFRGAGGLDLADISGLDQQVNTGAGELRFRLTFTTLQEKLTISNRLAAPGLYLNSTLNRDGFVLESNNGDEPVSSSLVLLNKSTVSPKGQGLFLHDVGGAEWFIGRPTLFNDQIVFARKSNAIHNLDVAQQSQSVFSITPTAVRLLGDSRYFESSTVLPGNTTTPTFTGMRFLTSSFTGTIGRVEGVSQLSNVAHGEMRFKVASNVNNNLPEDRMSIVGSTGHVGIGTNSPGQRLHVVGTARITNRGGAAQTITGWDVNSDLTNVSLGNGLNITGGILSVTNALTAFLQGGNSFAAPAVLGTNDANTMRVKASSYGLTLNPSGYITLDDTPSGPPSTPPIGSIFFASNSNALFVQADAGAAGTERILTEKTPNALLLISANATPGGANYNIRCDANGGAFTVTLGASLQEGKPYLVRCTRNSTNAITFTAASGYTLGIDTDTALTPTTLVSGAGGSGIAAPARIYIIQRIGTVINIK